MKKTMLMTGVALMLSAATRGETITSSTVVSNSGYLAELTLNASYTVGSAVNLRQNPQAAAPTKVTINNGGSLRLTDISSRVVAPLDLDIALGGKVFFPHGSNGIYARSTLIAHRLKVNGEEQAKGRYQGATSGGNSGWFEAQAGSSIVVPYVWTGAGDGTTWSDAANWEGNAVPPNADNYTTAVDLSRAAGRTITVSEAVRLTCIAFMPSGAQRTVTIGGTGSLWIHAPTALNGAFVIAEECEVALDVDLKRASAEPATWLSVVGGGRLTVRRGYPGVTLSTASTASSFTPPFVFDGTLAFAGPNAAIQVWWSARVNTLLFSVNTMEAQGHSRVVVTPDCTLDIGRILASCSGFYAVDEIIQEGGSVDLSVKSVTDLWLLNHNNSTRGLTYTLKDGTLNGSVCLGCNYSSAWTRYPGGSFRMTGGTLTASGIYTESNMNFFHLEGGHLKLGDAGITRTATTSGRTGGGNGGRSDIYLGGVTFDIITTKAIACPLSVELTGIGGDSVFDCNNGATSGGDISFNNGFAGGGSFVKRGANTMTFTSLFSLTGTMTVEAGKVVFSAASTLAGTPRIVVTGGSVEVASAPAKVTARPSFISLASAASLVLGSGIDMKANRLVVGGVEQTGTVTFGQGTVTVEASGEIAWKGANNGLWSVGSNWEGGSVPGANATVDVSSAEGKTILVDTADARVNQIVCRGSGTVTLKASGSGSLAFLDDTVSGGVEVGEGTRLLLDAPVKVQAKKSVYKTGRGTLVLEGGIAASAATAYFWAGQGVLEVQCAATDMRFHSWSQGMGASLGTVVVGEGADLSARSSAGAAWGTPSGDAIQNGGVIDMTTPAPVWTLTGYFPFCYADPNWMVCTNTATYMLNDGIVRIPNFFASSFYADPQVGDFAFVQNGGTASFGQFQMTRKAGHKARYELNGGTLQIKSGFYAPLGDYSIALNGGTIEAVGTQVFCPGRKSIELGGDVTIKPSADVTVTLPCDLAGDGALTVDGLGTVKTLLPLSGVKSLAVKGATLDLGGEVAATNLVLSSGAKLNLGFTGVQVVRRLTVNGREKAAGDYGVASGKTLNGRLTGAGTLRVLEGNDLGLMFLVR